MDGLKTLDVFGKQPAIYYFSKSRYKTYLGAFLSFSVGTMTTIMLIYFLNRVFNRSNIWVVESRQHSELESVHYGQYQQAMMVTKAGGLLYDEEEEAKLFRIEMLFAYLEDESSVKQSFKIFKAERCTPAHFGSEEELFADVPDIHRYYCLPKDTEFELYGVYGGKSKYSYTYYRILKCKEGSRGMTGCLSEDEVDTKMEGFYVNMLFVDYNLQNDNIAFPGQKYVKSERLQVGTKLFKRLFFELSVVEYVTDIGFIFEVSESQTLFTTSKVGLVPELNQSSTYFATTVSLSRTKIKGHRSFEKLQQVLSNLGGTLKALSVMAQVILRVLYNNFYYESLFDSLKTDASNTSTVIRKNKNTSATNLATNKEIQKAQISFFDALKLTFGCRNKYSSFTGKLKKLKRMLSIEKLLETVIRVDEVSRSKKISSVSFKKG